MTPYYAIRAAEAAATDLARCEVESILMAQVTDQSQLPDPTDPIFAFGNWNDRRSRDLSGFEGYGPHLGQETDPTMSRLMNILERMGVECEWSDEWAMCYDCSRMLRTSPDCYFWKLFGCWNEDGLLCGHCIDPDEYIELRLNNPKSAVNGDLVDLSALGFARLDTKYENGWHPGQDDDPVEILETLKAESPGCEFVFTFEPSQFYVEFTAWSRRIDLPDPCFDRFDICEAYLAVEQNWHSGGWLHERASNQRRSESTDVQLHRMGFKPGAGFNGYESLTENGKAIYYALEQRYGFDKEETL